MASENSTATLLIADNPDYVLLKLAMHFAEQGSNIWFISIAPFEKIPENITQPCREVLQLITFIYLKEFVDLIKHLNSVHKWKNLPNLIILKDFTCYVGINEVDYNPTKTAFLCATLIDSIKFTASKKKCTTFLLVSSTDLNERRILDDRIKVLYDMYFNKVLMKENFKSEEGLVEEIKNDFLQKKNYKTVS